LIASFAEEWGELVVESKLAFRENDLRLLSRLGERNDRVAANGYTASVAADKENKGSWCRLG
jgi:hypothetical protein